mgnify:CR=1 FL=1
MPRVELPIAGGSYESPSLPISAQRCVNWYPNIPQAPALGAAGLFGTAGLELLATSGEVMQSNRGAHVIGGIPYFINGEELWRLERSFVDSVETFAMVSVGPLLGSGRVSTADNGAQLMILAGDGTGYIYTVATDTLEEIVDVDFTANGTPLTVDYIDSYFMCATDEDKYIISGIRDGLSWNGTDVGGAEVDPDGLVANFTFKNQAFLFGSETIEVAQNVPQGADFPFQRAQGFVFTKGLSARYAVTQSNDMLYWIGAGVNESPAIWSTSGSTPQKVSTTAIDNILSEQIESANEGDLLATFAWSYAQRGAFFVGFTLPSAVIVYDVTTGLWHERESTVVDGRGNPNILGWRASSIVQAYQRVIAGDSQDGRVGAVDLDVYSEYGENIVRTVVTQPFANQGESLTVSELEITPESGVGNSECPDPQIMMSRSKDGKLFYSDRLRSMGKIGEYSRRVIWRRLGRVARFEVFKFVMSDKVKPVIIKLEASIKGGEPRKR